MDLADFESMMDLSVTIKSSNPTRWERKARQAAAATVAGQQTSGGQQLDLSCDQGGVDRFIPNRGAMGDLLAGVAGKWNGDAKPCLLALFLE